MNIQTASINIQITYGDPLCYAIFFERFFRYIDEGISDLRVLI